MEHSGSDKQSSDGSRPQGESFQKSRSFRAWAENPSSNGEPENGEPEAPPEAARAPRRGAGAKAGSGPASAPRGAHAALEAALRLMRASEGFANTGASAAERMSEQLRRGAERQEALLEKQQKVLSEIRAEREALSAERAEAVGERKALAKARKKTRQAGAQMRQDFLRGLEEEAQGTASRAIGQIKSGSAEAAERVVGIIENRLGAAVETATSAAQHVKGEMEAPVGRARSATADLEKASRRAARRTSWKPATLAIATAVVALALTVMGLTWMRPGWGLTELQRSGMKAGTGVIERYNGIQSKLQASLSRIGSLESGQREDGSALTEAKRRELRAQVMSLEEMQQRLARMEEIRSVMGWTPTEYARGLTEQVKALQEKTQ